MSYPFNLQVESERYQIGELPAKNTEKIKNGYHHQWEETQKEWGEMFADNKAQYGSHLGEIKNQMLTKVV
jgi:hypothetical protein